jgi:hypothetical protein
MTATLNATCTCPACGGSGKLPHYSHIANGDCFACGGTGTIRDLTAFIGAESDVSLEVDTLRGEFRGAVLRCRTWKNTTDANGQVWHTWGRDRWVRDITDADEARRVWRDAKRLGIKTNLWEHGS